MKKKGDGEGSEEDLNLDGGGEGLVRTDRT